MSPLFRKSEEQLAQRAAADAEITRLKALSVEDLALDMLPSMGPDGALGKTSVRTQQLCEYLLRDFPGAKRSKALDLLAPVLEALEALQREGLVTTVSIQRSPNWRITSLGKTALAQGTVEQRVKRTG
jgi:DNA-binding transcriptional ArsR family regulator